MKKFLYFGLTGCAFLAFGCDSSGPSTHTTEIVVESYQIAGEPLQPVWVTRTADVDASYVLDVQAVRGADVSVFLLDENGDREARFAFASYPGFSGEYRALENHDVIGGRTYELEVQPGAGFETVISRTRVPGSFDLLTQNANALPYQGDAQFEFNVTRSSYPTRQAIFIFSVIGLDPNIENLTPFYLDDIYGISDGESYDPNEFDPLELTDVLVNSSPPINEGNYDQLADGSLVVQLPWFAVAFYGETDVVMNAIDENTYDFVRYQQVQQGGSSLSPGEIPNVLDRVDNGRGLFGSLARVTARVTIDPKTP